MRDEDLKGIEVWCREDGLDLLIVDALSRVHTIGENKAEEMGPLLARLDDIRHAIKTAIEALHHEPKTYGDKGSDLDALRGSTRLQSDPTCLMRLVKHPTGLRELRFVKMNNAPDREPVWLRQRDSGVLEVTEAPGKKQTKEGDENRARVLEALQKHPGGVQVGVLAKEIPTTRGRHLSAATTRGHLVALEGKGARREGQSNATTWYPTAGEAPQEVLP